MSAGPASLLSPRPRGLWGLQAHVPRSHLVPHMARSLLLFNIVITHLMGAPHLRPGETEGGWEIRTKMGCEVVGQAWWVLTSSPAQACGRFCCFSSVCVSSGSLAVDWSNFLINVKTKMLCKLLLLTIPATTEVFHGVDGMKPPPRQG